jgi:carotenoid 1,2-hydratase
MPTLPLYTSPSHPDAWHNVTAPGGYEWWYFDAEDVANDRQIVAILLDGFIFHPKYLRDYAWYRWFPTHIAPPLPRWFRCAYFVVYERGRILSQFMRQYPSSEFEAQTDRPGVVLGSNQFHLDADSRLRLRLRGTPWKLTWQGPQHLTSQMLAAEFAFTPKFVHPPMERIFLSRQMTGAEHHWVIANPLCDVSGVIEIFDASTGRPKVIDFSGRGYHDHNYGTGPIGPGLARWTWGRVFSDDSVTVFHHAEPRNRELQAETHVVTADASGVRETIASVDIQWRRKVLGLPYPEQIRIGDRFNLVDPRIVDRAPFYHRLTHRTNRSHTSFTEVAYPHRLRWPVLGRMIEMSIGK